MEGVYPETHLKVDKFKECLDLFPDRNFVYFNSDLGDPMMNPGRVSPCCYQGFDLPDLPFVELNRFPDLEKSWETNNCDPVCAQSCARLK